MRKIIFVFMVLFCSAISVQACSIPVYRYALERWETDFYRVILFYKNELPKGINETLEPLVKTSSIIYGELPADVNTESQDIKANISLRFVDLANDPDPQMLELWQSQSYPELPWVVIRFPKSARSQNILWQGPLIALKASTLIESPARNEIIEHLLQGLTTVWVLLETGDKDKDQQALRQLTKGLEVARVELKLPEIGEQDEELWLSGENKIPLKIDFHIVRIARSDSKEIPFITMLIKSYPELMGRLQEPMAFPVFGRGRVLMGLAGEEITESAIIEVNRFLIDSCQCEVKEENPGVDLLMAVDWNRVFEILPVISQPKPPLTGVTNFLPSNETSVMPTTPTRAIENSSVKSLLALRVMLLLGLCFVFMVVFSLKVFILNK